jgi:aldehyde dehydrogenase (NAD+)
MDVSAVLSQLGVESSSFESGPLSVHTPIDGSVLGHVTPHNARDVQGAVAAADQAFRALRELPAPKRGELIRVFGAELRANKALLAELVSVESGKIRQEALGEVQEMIDICDFAVGLSRQLYGLTIASERAQHRMQEQWHPLGPVAVISAFNFPVAVWAWNFTLAIVCGNPVIWKPSEKTPLCALACQALWERAAGRANVGPLSPHVLSQVLLGGRDVGELLANDPRIALVSATGSTAMGRALAPKVAARFGRVLLELGGNNAMIVTPSADSKLAIRATLFSAVGTAGQRCTSLRRLFLHESIHDSVVEQLTRAYADLKIGSPLLPDTLVGPLIDGGSYERMQAALSAAREQGGKLIIGGTRVLADQYPQAFYVQPAIVAMAHQTEIVCQETFAPILYTLPYRTLDEAIDLHNAVEQGLSSSIFTTDIREAEQFLSARGSDCGIANVNIGPSGAEIGGAFGGEKATGGGRESGSDSWRSYMRRATNTINYGNELPLAQGIRFAD